MLIVPNDQDGQSFVIALDRATGGNLLERQPPFKECGVLDTHRLSAGWRTALS